MHKICMLILSDSPKCVGLCFVPVVAEEGLSCSPEPVRCLLGADNKNKTKKIIYDTAENDDFDRELIATYEEVAKLYPRPSVFRPIVLIGPPGVGRNELKRRLIDTDPVKFQTPTPCKDIWVAYDWIVQKLSACSYQQEYETWWSWRQRVLLRYAAANGARHWRREISGIRRIQGKLIWHQHVERRGNSPCRPRVHSEPPLPSAEDAQNSTSEALHHIHKPA